MKRPITDSKQFTVLRMFDEFARENGISLLNESGGKQFVEQMAVALKTHGKTRRDVIT
jgi:hypothetical protein